MSKKLFLKKRSFFFFCLLVLLGTGFAFKGALFHLALKKYVAHKVPLKGDWDFNYSYISLQEKGVAFHDIVLFSKDSDTVCNIGKIFCYAPLVENKSLSNHFVLDNLEIVLNKKSDQKNELTSKQLHSLLHSLRQVEVTKGKLVLPERELAFTLGKAVSNQKVGPLVIWSPHQGALKVDISSWADRWIVDIEARQSNLVFYKSVLDFFASEKTSDWKVENGKLDGSVFLAVSSNNTIEDARIHMNLLDGKLSNESAGVHSSFERVFIDASYPVSAAPASFLENIKITSSVDKGEICVCNEVGDKRFHFKDLSGFITASAFKEAAVDITGFIDDRGKLLPLTLSSKPSSIQNKGLELDLLLQLDPTFGHKARVNMVCSHEEGEFTIKSRLDSLEVRQMLIVQLCAGLFFPEVKEYTINDGSYSGEVLMAFDSDGIKDFSLRNLLCENLGLYSSEYDVALEATKVSGEIKIDLFQEKKTAFSDWELELVDGSFTIGREDNLPYYLENTNCKVQVKDGKFVDSAITGDLKGIKGRVNIDGEVSLPVLDLLLSGKGDDMLSLFCSTENEYSHDFMVSARVEKEEDKFLGEGTFTLHDAYGSGEVAFSFQTLFYSIEQLTFSSQDFSGRFYPFINELCEYDWTVDGDFSFEGELDTKKLSLAVLGERCTYREKHSFIKDAKGSARFVRYAENGSWNVDLLLEEGHKKVLAGKRLDLTRASISISSEDVYFKVRDFEGYMQIADNLPDLQVEVRKADFCRDGRVLMDLSLSNDMFELARLYGTYKEGEVSLNDYSHLLGEEIHLHECNFKDEFSLSLDSIVHFTDIAFPELVRKQGISDVACLLKVEDRAYELALKHANFDLLLKGDDTSFTLSHGGEVLHGTFTEDGFTAGSASFEFGKHQVKVSSISLDNFVFTAGGSVVGKDRNFSGRVIAQYLDGIVISGKGTGVLRIPEIDSCIVESLDEFTFSYDTKGTINDCHFIVSEKGTMLGEFSAKTTSISGGLDKVSFYGLKGSVSKEVLASKSGVEISEEVLNFEVDADLFLEEKDFWFSGTVDKKEFIFYDQVLVADKIKVHGNKKALIVDFTTPLYGEEIEVTNHIYFDEKVVLRSTGHIGDKKVLELDANYTDGIELYRMKGELVGLGFDVTPSTEVFDSDYKVEMNLDLQKMRPFLPAGMVEFIEQLEMGKGIELVGEVSFSDGFSFDGLMKGTDFDFLNYSISSMFAKLSFKDGVCKLKDFSIADRAFLATSGEITFDSSGEGCAMHAPQFMVSNLRPCLLSKKGERKKLSNPFMIETMEFNEVKGDLSDLNTIVGKGNIKFVNSFDKETNPIFDFAKEIIARIGLDPVLMVPVTGEMEFSLSDGKMNFLKLHNAYSDQARSYFYLWNKAPSYLDFDGNLHLDIRMKQYVLFRFTELFIISLQGPVSSPKVSLK